MTAQTVARRCEECTTRTVAKQRDTDDHVGEVMPLNDREEASQQHLEGEGPSRAVCVSFFRWPRQRLRGIARSRRAGPAAIRPARDSRLDGRACNLIWLDL